MHSKKLHRGLLGEEKPRLAFPQAFLPQVRARTRAGLKTCDLIKAGLFITDTEISQKQRFDQDWSRQAFHHRYSDFTDTEIWSRLIKAGLSSQIQRFHRYRDFIKIDQGRPFITDTDISQIQRFDQDWSRQAFHHRYRDFTDTEIWSRQAFHRYRGQDLCFALAHEWVCVYAEIKGRQVF